MFKRKPLLWGSIFTIIVIAGIMLYAILAVFSHKALPYMTSSSVPHSTAAPYANTNLSLPWKTYQNGAEGFSLSYPGNWVLTEDKSLGDRPDLGRVSFQSAEGSLDISWTKEPTVADAPCPQGNYSGGVEVIGNEPIQINGEVVTGCHFLYKTGFKEDTWRIAKVLSPNKIFLISVVVKEPLQQNKDIIFKALSTLKLGE
jgi:hypothetical protein